MANKSRLTQLNLKAISGCLCTMIFLLALVGSAIGQTSSTDGTTPLVLTPGAPAGSYPLSGLDNVNLFNGNLNFPLPLVHVADAVTRSTQ